MSPAHARLQRRWPALVLVVLVIAGLAVAARTPGHEASGGPPETPVATVLSSAAESSAWYCTGQTTAAGQNAVGSLVLTNLSHHAVSGTIDGFTETGASASTAVVVPAQGVIVTNVPAPESGDWISQAVTLAGGGVAVTESVSGPSGWSEAPCQSTTSSQWYFPSGITTSSDALFLSLFNPTSTPDVVDVAFSTPSGIVHPINFQGLVIKPDQTLPENVGAFVQNQSMVSTTVTTRTGRVVASELQFVGGHGSGEAIVPGSPRVESQWEIPQSIESAGGATTIDIYNPGRTTEHVTVSPRIATGDLTPFVQAVGPGSTWELATSAETRIPVNDPYVTSIAATGGPGVVVGRTVAAASTAGAPQVGLANAVDGLSVATPARQWLVPAPGNPATPVSTGVLPVRLALSNSTDHAVTYDVYVVTHGDRNSIATGRIRAHGVTAISGATLFKAGLNPLLVSADGPLAVSEDVGPSGADGVVTMPGIPLGAAL